jgi:Mlc titration factor MtfA (ptsG expression regulator)
MTLVEKRQSIKKIIDTLSNEKLEQAIFYLNQLTAEDKNRLELVKNMLIQEKELFDKLAQ